MDLLNKFWYSPLPPLGARSRYRVEQIHADYTVLLHRLMKYVILASHLRHRHIDVQHHSFRHCYSVLAISSLQSVRCCRSEHCGNLSCLFCIPVRVRLCFYPRDAMLVRVIAIATSVRPTRAGIVSKRR